MEGRTTLIIAHRLSTICLADRVVLLDQHKIVADGTHAELLETTPLYAEVLAQAASSRPRRPTPRRPTAEPGPDGHGRAATASRCGTCSTRCAAEAGPDVRRGGGGGFGAPAGRQASAASGLPFAGIPSELQAGVDQLLADEPDHGEPNVVFTRTAPKRERKRLSLWRLLTEYPGMLAWPACWWWSSPWPPRSGPSSPSTPSTTAWPRGHHDFGVVAVMAVAYLVSVGVTALAQRCQVQVTGRLAAWVMNDLRVKVFAHLQRLSLDFFTEEKAGVVMTRMTSDIENLQQLLQDGLSQFAIQGADHGGHHRHPLHHQRPAGPHHRGAGRPGPRRRLAVVPRASERGYDRVRDGIANVMADLSESLHGVRIVTAHNRQRHNVIHHRNVVGEYRDANDYTAHVNAVYGPGTQLLGVLGQAVLLAIGGNMVLAPHAVHRRPGGLLPVPEPVLPAHPAAGPAVQHLPAGPGLGDQAPRPCSTPSPRCARPPTPSSCRPSRARSSSTT